MEDPQTTPPDTGATPSTVGKPPRSSRRFVLLLLAGATLTVGFYYGLDYTVLSLTHESTDDAFLESHIVTVASRVAGQVTAVHVKENQRVTKGEALGEIDPRDFEVHLAQKRAASSGADASFASAQAGLELVKARYETALATERQEKANADAARAKAQRAQADLKRAETLRQNGVMSQEEYDSARAGADSTSADLRAAEQKVAATTSQVAESHAQIGLAQTVLDSMATKIKQAQSDQDAAALDLSYTRITAPCDGQVTRKSVEPGNYVQVGQALLALVPTNLWIVANFKESQLTHLKAGLPAQIRIDAYPDRRFKGHVDSFQAGSGSRFSLLPPENAVGNYVKIVQRVPVKLYFDEPLDPAMSLGPGMSVVPQVRTSDFTTSPALVWLAALVLAALATLALARVMAHLRD